MNDYNFISIVILGLPINMQSQMMTMKIDTKNDLIRVLGRIQPNYGERRDKKVFNEKQETKLSFTKPRYKEKSNKIQVSDENNEVPKNE